MTGNGALQCTAWCNGRPTSALRCVAIAGAAATMSFTIPASPRSTARCSAVIASDGSLSCMPPAPASASMMSFRAASGWARSTSRTVSAWQADASAKCSGSHPNWPGCSIAPGYARRIFRTRPISRTSRAATRRAWCRGRLPWLFLSFAQSLSASSSAATTPSSIPCSMQNCSGVLPASGGIGGPPGTPVSTLPVRTSSGLALIRVWRFWIAFFDGLGSMALRQWNTAVYPFLHGLSIPSGNASRMSARTEGCTWHEAARCSGSSFAPLLRALPAHVFVPPSHMILTRVAKSHHA
mmetsp:Transcript_3493/g.14261  ORF Transcript_3493/g.14261 Transcript_3493/m.14261 type:complete len:295 (+) Transcript_3493:351-1235(+)